MASFPPPSSELRPGASTEGLEKPGAPAPNDSFHGLVDCFLFESCFADPDRARRARLVSWFGLLGSAFGMLYAIFYCIIGHRWGVGIVAVCSLGFAATPLLMRVVRSTAFGGNFLAAIMTLGFTSLCYVEGGLRGHAVAWLASVPLCALLLVGKRSAGIWVIISFAAAASVVGADIAEIELPMKYDRAWHPLVDSAGYLGLIAFMFALGLIFEVGREQAFGRLTAALRELGDSNAKLSALNREKTEFLGIAAHDLRNPLTIIISYAELLAQGHPKVDAPKFASTIYDAGVRMRDLVGNLLTSNAIEEGVTSCKIGRCDIAEVIAQSSGQNQVIAGRKQTRLTSSVAPGLCARSDLSITIQIVDNLLSNAIKYSPPGSEVSVRAERRNGEVAIEVRDQGPGISEADQRKLFGKFCRLSARPTGGESSTGLGLSIVKRLAEVVHGRVECESTLGSGATFRVLLPAWPEEVRGVFLPNEGNADGAAAARVRAEEEKDRHTASLRK